MMCLTLVLESISVYAYLGLARWLRVYHDLVEEPKRSSIHNGERYAAFLATLYISLYLILTPSPL